MSCVLIYELGREYIYVFEYIFIRRIKYYVGVVRVLRKKKSNANGRNPG